MSDKMSVFAETITNQKYAHDLAEGRKETWPEIARRVAQNVFSVVDVGEDLEKEAEQLIANRILMPAGRYLYASGRELHQVQNCYGRETCVVTRYGTREIGSLSGQTVELMTTGGHWVRAPIRSFGVQNLMKVTLTRAGVQKEIWATAEHSWRVSIKSKRGSATKSAVTTEKLKPGQKLWAVYGYGISRTPISPAGIQHGVVYGDGNVPKDDLGFNTANVRLCGSKDAQLLRHFVGYPTRPIGEDTEVSRLPRYFKEPVALTHDRSYLLGWLAGYFAADGCVSADGVPTISSTDRASLQLVKDVCYLLGIGAYSIRFADRISNLNGKPSRLYSVALMRHTLSSEFFLIDEHRKRFEANPPSRAECMWNVVSVEKTERMDDVFCAVVEDTHEFVLEDNILTGNCLLLRADDSREGWADLMNKATMALMTGAGIGVVYSDVRPEGAIIHKTGGHATGPLALMQMVNEAGRFIMQGGSRRSAIWAGLHWNHPDCLKFVQIKNWSPEVRKLKEKDYNFPAPLDGTNVSVILDDAFFVAYDDEANVQHSLAHTIYWAVVRQMLKTAEPGFSIDVGNNVGENLRNACVPGSTEILTDDGYKRIDSLVGQKVNVWNGFEWSAVEPQITGHARKMLRIKLSSGQELVTTENHHFWLSTDYRGAKQRVEARHLRVDDKLIKCEYPVIEHGESVEWAYSQGFVSGDGMDDYGYASVYQPKFPCLSRLSGTWKMPSTSVATRVNVHWNFTSLPKTFVPTKWNLRSRLDWLAGLLDSDGTELKEGGAQIASVDRKFLLDTQKMLTTMGVASKVTAAQVAGMRSLPDGKGGLKDYPCQDLYRLLIGAVQVQDLKRCGLRCERLMFQKTPQRDASQFVRVMSVENAGVEETVYCFTEAKRNLGCFEGVVTGQCTEITSYDDSDICNLASINMARIDTLEQMERAVVVGTTLLLAGTVYSDLPYEKVGKIREKNRRLGLGLMGLHEWLLKRGKKYGPDAELEQYLRIYERSTEIAHKLADAWGISRPAKTRAIAPTGTIGIVAETTTGMEPIFCVAYKRRYLKGSVMHYQYVIDPTAHRLIEIGVKPESIEDAYSLAEDVERRVGFQAWLQRFVDHSISSTVNLPSWGSELNNDDRVRPFGEMLMKYLPQLRGITCYPDGARGGQPLTPVRYATAVKHLGIEMNEAVLEQADVCDISKGGSCGS